MATKTSLAKKTGMPKLTLFRLWLSFFFHRRKTTVFYINSRAVSREDIESFKKMMVKIIRFLKNKPNFRVNVQFYKQEYHQYDGSGKSLGPYLTITKIHVRFTERSAY
jgi:hypothetical protein